MRCCACDCELSDQEATRKSSVTGEYLDMCNHCLSYIIDDMLQLDIDIDVQLEES